MSSSSEKRDVLIEKIRTLPENKLAEVSDFVDSIDEHGDSQGLIREISQLSEQSFRSVWENPDDSLYDEL